jgi:hypothetical protein
MVTSKREDQSMQSFVPSQKAARTAAMQQQAEIDKQRTENQVAQAASLQDSLGTETNRLLRVFGSRSLATVGRPLSSM